MSKLPPRAIAGALVLTSFAAAGLTAVLQDDVVADGLVDQADPAVTLRASSAPEMGDLLTKSETLWYDAQAKRLGIGQQPQATLHVYGNSRIVGPYSITENIGQGPLQVIDMNYTRAWSADPRGIQSHGGPLELNPLGNNAVTLNNALRVMPTGRVGLGVENPIMDFDMKGVFRTTDTIVSTKPTGAPFNVASTGMSANLNADMLDGFHADEFSRFGSSIEGTEIEDGTITAADISPDARIPASAIKPVFNTGVEFMTDVRIGGTITFGDGTEMDSAPTGGSASGGTAIPDLFDHLSVGAVQSAEGRLAVAGAQIGDYSGLAGDVHVEDRNARLSLLASDSPGGGASIVLARSAESSLPAPGTKGGSNPLNVQTSFEGAWSIEHRHKQGTGFTQLDFKHSGTPSLEGLPVLTLAPDGEATFNTGPDPTSIGADQVNLLGGRLSMGTDSKTHLWGTGGVFVDDPILRGSVTGAKNRIDFDSMVRFSEKVDHWAPLEVHGDVLLHKIVTIQRALVVGEEINEKLDDKIEELEIKFEEIGSKLGEKYGPDAEGSIGRVYARSGRFSDRIVAKTLDAQELLSDTFASLQSSLGNAVADAVDATTGTFNSIESFNFFNLSSKRFKQDIEDLDDARAIVRRLRGVRYRHRPATADGREEPGPLTVGVIAEEVAEVLPEIVAFRDGEPIGVDYGRLSSVLLEVVKEQDAELTAMQTLLADLEARLTALEKE